MSIWDRVIGQPAVVTQLRAAAAAAHDRTPGPEMTHAWLITGPPGSGRSIAAESFAAALVCSDAGCGQCADCFAALAGSHPDVDLVRSTTLSHSKERAIELVVKAAGAPAVSEWRVIVVEDADRMTEAAANSLLKAIEEPTARTVWILCAPSAEDLLPTIRSRTRHIALRVPDAEDVAAMLRAEGVDPAMAGFTAAASQGHIGRARALATDETARKRRLMVLRTAGRLENIEQAYAAAQEWKTTAEQDARKRSKDLDAVENDKVLAAYGQGATGVSAAKVRSYARGALSRLARTQQLRASRSVRDELDRYFVDLLGFYRDILALQLEAPEKLINPDLRPEIERLAARDDPVLTMERISAIVSARAELSGNVPPMLVCEALMVQLLHPVRT